MVSKSNCSAWFKLESPSLKFAKFRMFECWRQMERPGLPGFLNCSFMFKTNIFDFEKNIVVSGFLSNSRHLNFRHIGLLTLDCWRKVEWAGIASFPNFSTVIFKANIYGFEKIIVVSGFPSNNRNPLFHQLGEPTKGWCQKIVWQIIESLLNFFFSIFKTKISQRPLLCCANADEKLSDFYFSVRYTICFLQKHQNNTGNR